MKINQNNYEAYLLDYLEGHIDADTKKDLEIFLQQNPSIKTTLDQFESISIVPDIVKYPSKSDLYKLKFEKSTITESNYGDYCIAYHENILTEEKRKECIHFSALKYENEKELMRSGKVYLTPDLNIIYPDKKNLKHKNQPVRRTVIRMAAIVMPVAASVIFGLFIYNQMNNSKPKNLILKTITKKERVETKFSPINLAVTNPKNNTQKTKKVFSSYKEEKIQTKVENKAILPHPADSSLKTMIAIEPKLQTLQVVNNKLDITKTIVQNTTIPSTEKDTSSINKYEESINTQKNSLLALAETGITKINQLTGSNIELSHQTNESGKIKVISINTGIFGFYRRRSK
jgi:hypothetical protein